MNYAFVATFQEFKSALYQKIELNSLEIQCLWDYSCVNLQEENRTFRPGVCCVRVHATTQRGVHTVGCL